MPRDLHQLAIYPSLQNRAAIVTGGASGIGASIVWRLSQAGARVAFVDLQDEAAEALIARIRESGMRPPLYRRCDVADTAALLAALESIRQALGPASVLVNNVGDDTREAFETVTPESFDRAIRVNLTNVFFASRAVAAQMRQLGGGSIINMSSGIWQLGYANTHAYSAAKAAIVGLTNSLARELGPDDIRVNAIAPGAVMTERQLRLWLTPADVERLVAEQCLHRRLEAEEIAEAVLFLAADESRMITKQYVPVNGGLL